MRLSEKESILAPVRIIVSLIREQEQISRYGSGGDCVINSRHLKDSIYIQYENYSRLSREPEEVLLEHNPADSVVCLRLRAPLRL